MWFWSNRYLRAPAPRSVKIAQQIKDGVDAELKQKIMIGIGTVTDHIRDLGRIYKEAQMAIEVGKVFETERTIINYDNLGIGRLIYQLPVTCVRCSSRRCSRRTHRRPGSGDAVYHQ